MAEAGVVQPKVDLRSRATVDKGTGGRGVADVAFKLVELRRAEERIDLTLTSGKAVRFVWGSRPPFNPIPTATQLPAGRYLCRVWPNGEIRITDDYAVVLTPFSQLDAALQRAFSLSTSAVPCNVIDAASSAAAAGAGGLTAPATGPGAIPLRGSLEALRDNGRLRALAWEMLAHFTGAPEKQPDQVTLQDIEARMAAHAQSRDVVLRITQGFVEYQQAGTADWSTFERLTETLVEQFVYGNPNFALNRFAIRNGPQGWGLYHRVNGIRFYDALGMPVQSFMGTLWDKHYRFARSSGQPSGFGIEVSPDDPMFAILEAYRAGGIPSPDQLEAAASGYLDNAGLLYEEFRREPASFERLTQRLHDQFEMLAKFIFVECVSAWMVAQPVPAIKGVGLVIRGGLTALKYYMQIAFVEDTVQVVLRIGASLYRVTPDAQGRLDSISKRHLKAAAEDARHLIETITELVMILLAADTAGRLANLKAPRLPPPQQPAFAPASGMRVGGTGAAAAGAPGPAVIIPPGLIVASMNAEEAAERLRERQQKEAQRADERERRRDEQRDRKAAERARKEAERSWRDLERELFEYLAERREIPGEKRYFDRQAKTILEDVLKELEARAQDPAALQRVQEARARLDALKDCSIGSLLEEVGLGRAFARYREYIERSLRDAHERLRSADIKRREWDSEDPAYRELREEVTYLEKLRADLDAFRDGRVGTRRFDATQAFLEQGRVAITDATMRVGEIFHQMKSIVYREIVQNVLPEFQVEVWEFRSDTAVQEIRTTSDYARELERSVDAKIAQER